MAVLTNKFFKGVLGPVVFKERKGKQQVVTKVTPGTMKQTTATKSSQHTFGMASSLGAHIREAFQYDIYGLNDGEMTPRLSGAINQSLNFCRDPESKLYYFVEDSFYTLANFDFNTASKLNHRLGLNPKATVTDGVLKIAFPDHQRPYKLKFPKGSTSCIMTISVTLFRLRDGLRINIPTQQTLTIGLNDAILNGKTFLFDVPDGCLCIAGIFLKYYTNRLMINNKLFSPAAICDALITPGVFVEDDNLKWVELGLRFKQDYTE